MDLEKILNKNEFSKNDVCDLLKLTASNDLQKLQHRANEILLSNVSNDVFIRGLIEFSNYCVCDCCYCGIRKSNINIERYQLTVAEIIDCINFAKEVNFAAVVLQSGERNDAQFIDYLLEIIKAIKKTTTSEKLPNGFGITLSIGEQTEDNYRKLFDAGAERFLLRIETTNKNLFEEIHTVENNYARRTKCISLLQKIGFQVGTGVMIGLPEQTVEDLAEDIIFFKENDIDMIGMGPYIPHKKTPMGEKFLQNNNLIFDKEKQLQLGLNMIAVARIVLKDVNIASTTALETLCKNGRLLGLQYGANVVMPQLTPNLYKANYLLYDKKPTVNENSEKIFEKFTIDCENIGRKVAFGKSGTSLHYFKKHNCSSGF